MADRLAQKKQIAERLYSVISQAQQNLSPEEMEISGIKNVSRKLGEFIGTPAVSTAWDYDALSKLDGPQLFRAVAGAWDGGQRTNNGKLIIQKGGGRLKIKNPFTGEEKLKDTRPGTRVHHKVQVASIYRPIEHLSIDRQIDLVEALAERSFKVGNDPDNIVSLLDYTHEYAGNNAAHVWGDTVGRHFRANITSDMSFDEQLEALIDTAIKPQYRDILRATGPGTVEYAVNLQRSKDFRNITGKDINGASPDDIKQFNKFLDERKSLPLDKRDAFDESLVDPENRQTYDIYRNHHENVVAGRRTSGLGPLKGGERKELDKILAGVRETGPNVGAYLSTLNNGQPVPSRGSVRTDLVNKVRDANALKMGYPSGFAAATPEGLAIREAGKLINKNRLGALAGVGFGGTDREVGKKLGQGDYRGAAVQLGTNATIGAAGEAALKAGSKSLLKALAKRAPALASRVVAGSAASGGLLAPALAAYGLYDIADGVVEGATGKGISTRINDAVAQPLINRAAQENAALVRRQRENAVYRQQVATQLRAATTQKLTAATAHLPKPNTPRIVKPIPKPTKSFKPLNELKWGLKQLGILR